MVILITTNLHTKFDMFGFNCSKDITRTENLEIGHVTIITPPSGMIFIDRLGLAMVSQDTKFKVCVYTRYEDMKDEAKYRKWGDWGWIGVTQGHQQCHHSIERIQLPIRL